MGVLRAFRLKVFKMVLGALQRGFQGRGVLRLPFKGRLSSKLCRSDTFFYLRWTRDREVQNISSELAPPTAKSPIKSWFIDYFLRSEELCR